MVVAGEEQEEGGLARRDDRLRRLAQRKYLQISMMMSSLSTNCVLATYSILLRLQWVGAREREREARSCAQE